MIWFGISSYPYEFIDFMELTIFPISLVEAYLQFSLVKGMPWYFYKELIGLVMLETLALLLSTLIESATDENY
jgi:hypothetical protein